MKNPIEEYMEHLEGICQANARYFAITEKNEVPPIAVASFEGVPDSGCTTAFSFGLSSADRIEWRYSRPELVICVNSIDAAWPIAMGEMIRNGRNRCPFSIGTVLHFGQRVSDESDMTSFLVFSCTALEGEDLEVQLTDRRIVFSQIYPIHASESTIVRDIGAEKFFFDFGIDFFDVRRRAIG